jgi:UDP-glucose 4-epimerase
MMVERLLADCGAAHGLQWVALRYFNASGADPAGETGEAHDPESHLIPRALMAVDGALADFQIFGTDYPTPDGTCVRDYIHVSDLADAHVAALGYLAGGGSSAPINLGVGRGFSVREIIDAVQRVTGRTVPVRYGPRREGDPAMLVADPALARRLLDFKPRFGEIDAIVDTAWRWHNHHRAMADASR